MLCERHSISEPQIHFCWSHLAIFSYNLSPMNKRPDASPLWVALWARPRLMASLFSFFHVFWFQTRMACFSWGTRMGTPQRRSIFWCEPSNEVMVALQNAGWLMRIKSNYLHISVADIYYVRPSKPSWIFKRLRILDLLSLFLVFSRQSNILETNKKWPDPISWVLSSFDFWISSWLPVWFNP